MEPVQPPNTLVRLDRRPPLRQGGWQHDWPGEAQEAEPAPWRMLVLISVRVLPSRRPPPLRRSLSPPLRRSRAARQGSAWRERRERRNGVRRFVAIAGLLTVLSILGAGLIDSDDAGPEGAEGAAAPSISYFDARLALA